jgi:hypothetical protein
VRFATFVYGDQRIAQPCVGLRWRVMPRNCGLMRG